MYLCIRVYYCREEVLPQFAIGTMLVSLGFVIVRYRGFATIRALIRRRLLTYRL